MLYRPWPDTDEEEIDPPIPYKKFFAAGELSLRAVLMTLGVCVGDRVGMCID